jgi:hypothetical protein
LIDRYEGLGERDAVAELGGLTQVDLTAIQAFERSHRDRAAVLNKLRYLRQSEPLPGYDALEPAQIAEALLAADIVTVKAVREYERKLQHRASVLKDVSRALHTDGQPAAAGAESPAPFPVRDQAAVVGAS